jgi:hypothetical protein
MKINFIIYSVLRTGGLRVIFEYANKFSEQGHDVIVYHSLLPYKHKKYVDNEEWLKQIEDKIHNIISWKNIIKSYGNIKFKIKLIPLCPIYL